MTLAEALSLSRVCLSVTGPTSPLTRREQPVPKKKIENLKPHGFHLGTSKGFF